MDPVPNPVPTEPATERSAVRSRSRGMTPEVERLVERLRGLEPTRAQIVARARARLMDGTLDSGAAARVAAEKFLSGDWTDTDA